MSALRVVHVALLASCLLPPALAKVYEVCEFGAELLRNGFDAELVPTFVCLADHLTKLDSEARSQWKNTTKNRSYGIFMISSRFWCCPSLDCAQKTCHGCNVACEALVFDVGQAAQCAMLIYKQTAKEKGDGFLAWRNIYQRRCKPPPAAYMDCPPRADVSTEAAPEA